MILGDPDVPAIEPTIGRRVAIDDLFGRVAKRNPEALAVADPPNRSAFTDDSPRRLNYAQADRMVTAIAGRLHRMGLPGDAIVGIHLPNTAEGVLAFLGVLRAGMIAAPLPLLWRRAEAVEALSRLGAKALITCGRVGTCDHGQLGMQVAAQVFCMRYVCGFGPSLPDGVLPFDELFAIERLDPVPKREEERQRNPADHVAAITWEVGAEGLVPVARNHHELLAGGLAVVLEARIGAGATILSAIAPSSFAGLSLTIVPWLLSGGALLLHHGFDYDALAGQLRAHRCDVLILPGPLLMSLAGAGVLAGQRMTPIGVWRAPEGLAACARWHETGAELVDVAVFGETALHAARRAGDGKPMPITLGRVVAPAGGADAMLLAEIVRTGGGTLALRGPMVPRHPFPPGVERSAFPRFRPGSDGFVDTGYPCRAIFHSAAAVSGRPAGTVSVGGYRFSMPSLQKLVGQLDTDAVLTAQPDGLLGHRLLGNAPDRDAVAAGLAELGVNPMLIAAFGEPPTAQVTECAA